MAGPERALPGDGGHSRLRASHADRDGVISTLKSAYVLGFVTKPEFDARVSQTLAARTHADLAGVTSDLPAWLAAAQPPAERASSSKPIGMLYSETLFGTELNFAEECRTAR